MNLKVYNYLQQYIQKKYPLYCEAITNKDFMSFVNAIASSPLFNKYSVDVIKSGSKNDVVDRLVDQYARIMVYDVWFKNICQNLGNYIKDKYPMYCKFMDDSEFDSLLKSIVENDKFVNKKYGLPEVLSSQTDELVDELVEVYAQLNLTDVWANYENLCNYIKNVIISSRHNVISFVSDKELYINDKTLDDIVEKLANEFIKKNEKYTNYMNRSYDQIFLINFDAFFDEIKRECMDCIRNVTKKSIVKLTDESVNEYLLEQVMSKSLVKYNVDDIVSGKYDEEIIRIYEECFNEIERELVSFIRSFLFRNVDFGDMLDVSEEKVVSHFINKDNIEKSFIKMRSGKLGKDIIECIKKQKSETSVRQKTESVVTPIVNDGEMRRENSVKSNKPNTSNKMKHTQRKRKMHKTIISLLLAGTLTTAAIGLGNAVYERIDDVVTDIKYSSTVRQFEQLGVADTDMIFTVHSDQYNQGVDSVIDFYSFCKKHGLENPEEFCLGFNLVRNQVRSDNTLAVMDRLLSNVQSKVDRMDGVEDFKQVIDDSCFLEFAYELLLEMGCEEVKDDKYFQLVYDYQEAMRMADKNSGKTPYDYLSDSNKKLASKVMNLYWEYTKDYVIETGKKLNEDTNYNDRVVLLTSAYDNNHGNGRR